MKKPLTKVNGFLVAGTGLEPLSAVADMSPQDQKFKIRF
ncbi:hypothetical protein RCH19_000147 [Flavobacterium sp. PL12]